MPLPMTTMSTKGQVILPKAVRESRNLKSGTKLTVEETSEGILLRPVKESPFPTTTIDEVLALARELRKHGVMRTTPISAAEMDEAVGEAIMEDWERLDRD